VNGESAALQAAIAALQAQRALLGDAVVDRALAPLQERLTTIESAEGGGAAVGAHLRQVSVLFMDIVGSTTLSRLLDTEDNAAVLDGALKRCTAVVAANGGRVLQYAGDNLLAAFGADGAQEDDAERAVRCGLALLAEGRAMGAEVLARHGHAGFDVRVGVHSGGVLLGGMGGMGGLFGGSGDAADESSIRGITVHIAARMEQTAPPGGMRISQATQRLVRGVFLLQPQDPLHIKGVDEPVRSWLVEAERPPGRRGPGRGVDGMATPLVGREAELAQLQVTWQRLRQAGAGFCAFTVVAEAGVGKSRLIAEFLQRTAAGGGVPVLQARSTPQSPLRPYGLLRDLFAGLAGIADGEDPAVARAAFERAVLPVLATAVGAGDAPMHLHLLGQLLGLDYGDSPHVAGIRGDGIQIRQRGFHAAVLALRGLAGRATAQAVLLLLDDLHWADDASLDFIDHLARAAPELPLLLLLLTRPTLGERRTAPPAAAAPQSLRIELAPLDADKSETLAAALLQRLPDAPASLRTLLTRAADGNPFYMEEVLNMLIDAGAIDTGAEHWTLHAERLREVRVPETLTGVLQARLDGLPAVERHALQLASVVGASFWDSALAYISASAVQQLPPLARRALVLPLVPLVPLMPLNDAREFTFRHPLLHQVTYDTVLKSQRRGAHARAADWFAQAGGPRSQGFAGLAAHHYERAGNSAKACEQHLIAAELALAGYAGAAVLDHVARILALTGSGDDRLRWRALCCRERIFDGMGRRGEQQADIASLLLLAESLDDDALRAEAAWRSCDIAHRTGDWATQQREAERAQCLAEQSGDDALALRALQRLALARVDHGDALGGRALATQGLARAQALQLPALQLRFLNALGVCAERLGEAAENLRLNMQTRPLSRALGDLRSEAIDAANLGIGWLRFGALDAARAELEDGLHLSRLTGNRAVEGALHCPLATLALFEGDADRAAALARAGLRICAEVGNRRHLCNIQANLGNAELARGDHPAAALAFEAAAALARDIRDDDWLLDSLCGLARAALASGDTAKAVGIVEAMLQHAAASAPRATNPYAGASEHQIRLTVHEVWAAAGNARADTALDEAHAALQAAAAAIDDDSLRHGFLSVVPEHRRTMALWQARAAAAA